MKISYDRKYENQVDFAGYEQFLKKYDGYTGWINIEKLAEENLINRIKAKSAEIIKNCDVFLIVGIGGSFTGARAVIESLRPYFSKHNPEIYYVGNSLSSEYLKNLKEKIKNKDIVINYISKSGNTLETKIIFDDLLDFMKEKYDEAEIKKRIIYTTGNADIVLDGCEWFLIPKNIGGRFSVFSPVGLLPMAVAGINIDNVLSGASQVNINLAKQYAMFRDKMGKIDKQIEAFVVYEPKLFYLLEWIKQIYAESLGKEEQGIFSVGLVNTTDLHSTGQFLQEGNRNIFETVINFNEQVDIYVPSYQRNLREINQIALQSTIVAHQEKVPNLLIEMGDLTDFKIGELLQFFMISCVMSGYISNINPFLQEGVEEYKREMLKRLN